MYLNAQVRTTTDGQIRVDHVRSESFFFDLGQDNTFQWVFDSADVEISGTVTDGGQPIETVDGDLTFGLTFRPDDGGPALVWDEYASYYSDTNEFELLPEVRIVGPGELDVRLIGIDDRAVLGPIRTFELDQGPGVYEPFADWDLDLADGEQAFAASGTYIHFPADSYTVEITAYTSDPDDWTWAPTPAEEFVTTAGPGTSWTFEPDLPVGTQFVKVVVDGEWSRTFRLDPWAPEPVIFDVDETAAPRVRFEGTVVFENCLAPLLFEQRYWLFDHDPFDVGEFPDDSGPEPEWGTGELIDRVLIAADDEAPYEWNSTVFLDPWEGGGSRWLGVDQRTAEGGYIGTIEIQPDSLITVSGPPEQQYCDPIIIV